MPDGNSSARKPDFAQEDDPSALKEQAEPTPETPGSGETRRRLKAFFPVPEPDHHHIESTDTASSGQSPAAVWSNLAQPYQAPAAPGQNSAQPYPPGHINQAMPPQRPPAGQPYPGAPTNFPQAPTPASPGQPNPEQFLAAGQQAPSTSPAAQAYPGAPLPQGQAIPPNAQPRQTGAPMPQRQPGPGNMPQGQLPSAAVRINQDAPPQSGQGSAPGVFPIERPYGAANKANPAQGNDQQEQDAQWFDSDQSDEEGSYSASRRLIDNYASKPDNRVPPLLLASGLILAAVATGGGLFFLLHGKSADKKAPPPVVSTSTVGESIAAARSACKDNQLQQALFHLDNAVKLAPTRADLLSWRATVEIEAKDFGKAASDLTQALKLQTGSASPSESILLTNRAYARYHLGQYKEALADYQAAEKQQPASPSLLLGEALNYRQLADDNQALDRLSKALKSEPSNYAANLESGNIEFCRGNYKKAIAFYDQSIKTNPQSAEALYARASAHLKANSLAQAERDYTAAIKIDGQKADYFNDRGCVLARLHKTAAATADFRQALSLDPEHKSAQENLKALQSPGAEK